MTKSETIKQLAAASNAARLKELGQGIDALDTAKVESAQQLAAMLEPLAVEAASVRQLVRFLARLGAFDAEVCER